MCCPSIFRLFNTDGAKYAGRGRRSSFSNIVASVGGKILHNKYRSEPRSLWKGLLTSTCFSASGGIPKDGHARHSH